MMFRLDRFFLRLPFLLSLAVTLALACHAFSRCGFRTALDGAVACLELALAEQAVRKELFLGKRILAVSKQIRSPASDE